MSAVCYDVEIEPKTQSLQGESPTDEDAPLDVRADGFLLISGRSSGQVGDLAEPRSCEIFGTTNMGLAILSPDPYGTTMLAKRSLYELPSA